MHYKMHFFIADQIFVHPLRIAQCNWRHPWSVAASMGHHHHHQRTKVANESFQEDKIVQSSKLCISKYHNITL